MNPNDATTIANFLADNFAYEMQTTQRVINTEELSNHRATQSRALSGLHPATIRWLGSDDAVYEAVGMVRDVSTCRVYVNAAHSLGTNDSVELEIVPFGLGSENSKTELHFEGKVVRTKQQGLRPGFAVAGFLWLAKVEPHVLLNC